VKSPSGDSPAGDVYQKRKGEREGERKRERKRVKGRIENTLLHIRDGDEKGFGE